MENQNTTTNNQVIGEEVTMNNQNETLLQTEGNEPTEPAIEEVTAETGASAEETEGASTESSDVKLVAEKDGQFNLLFGEDFITGGTSAGSDNEDGCGTTDTSPKSRSAKTSAKATAGGSTAKAAAKPPKKDPEITLDWTIHYARATFPVAEFFDGVTPLPEKVTTKEIREKMAETYFEMTEARTSWDFDEENKRLYPRVNGTSKGSR